MRGAKCKSEKKKHIDYHHYGFKNPETLQWLEWDQKKTKNKKSRILNGAITGQSQSNLYFSALAGAGPLKGIYVANRPWQRPTPCLGVQEGSAAWQTSWYGAATGPLRKVLSEETSSQESRVRKDADSR